MGNRANFNNNNFNNNNNSNFYNPLKFDYNSNNNNNNNNNNARLVRTEPSASELPPLSTERGPKAHYRTQPQNWTSLSNQPNNNNKNNNIHNNNNNNYLGNYASQVGPRRQTDPGFAAAPPPLPQLDKSNAFVNFNDRDNEQYMRGINWARGARPTPNNNNSISNNNNHNNNNNNNLQLGGSLLAAGRGSGNGGNGGGSGVQEALRQKLFPRTHTNAPFK